MQQELYILFFIHKIYMQQNLYLQSLYVTKFTRNKVSNVTVYMSQSL
jgi:hypothetical protein